MSEDPKHDKIRAGDFVQHKKSGEELVVARIARDGWTVYTAGWPLLMTTVESLQLVEACSDDDHAWMVGQCKRLPPSDPRWMPSEDPTPADQPQARKVERVK